MSTAITKNQQKTIPSPSIHESILKKIRELKSRKSERIEDDIRCGQGARAIDSPMHASRCTPVNSRRRRAVVGMSSRAHAAVVEVVDEGRHCRRAD
jgi:hypothetical protein